MLVDPREGREGEEVVNRDQKHRGGLIEAAGEVYHLVVLAPAASSSGCSGMVRTSVATIAAGTLWAPG